MKQLAALLIGLLLIPGALAQAEMNPGITPDSPFYFADRLLDVFQSVESRVNERAAEAIVMAQENHQEGFEKAVAGYEKAMQKREQQAQNSAEQAEELAYQATENMIGFANARTNVEEQAKEGLDNIAERSATGRERALSALEATNQDRAGVVANETLSALMEQVPAQARAGIQNAIDARERRGPPTSQVNDQIPEVAEIDDLLKELENLDEELNLDDELAALDEDLK